MCFTDWDADMEATDSNSGDFFNIFYLSLSFKLGSDWTTYEEVPTGQRP